MRTKTLGIGSCVCIGIAALGVAEAQSYDVGEGWRGETEGGAFAWRLGGRFHLDSAQYDSDVTPLEDNSDLRRGRVTFRGELREDWRLAADYEFADIAGGWKSLYAEYRGWGGWRMTVGNQVVPFSMDEITSSNDLPFLERALPNALSPGLLTGASFETAGRSWSFAGGVFADELSDQERRRADGHGVAARFTAAPVRREGAVVHLGVAAELRTNDDGVVRFRARPESYMTSERLVDTGNIAGVDDLATLGLEAAGMRGPFSVRAEYLRTSVPGTPAFGDLAFDGHYVAVGYVLTGESLSYSRRSGTFGGVEPRGRRGAVELVARVSSLDLTDGAVQGGVERNRSIGVNWYLRDSLRLMVNYIDIEAAPNAAGTQESPSILQLRFQANL